MSRSIASYPNDEKMAVIQHRLKTCKGSSFNQSGLGFHGAVDALKNRKKHNIPISDEAATAMLEQAK